MTAVKLSQELPVPAQAVWSVIGGFNGLPDWHPAVEKSESKTEGGVKVRTLTLVGGGQIVERLEHASEQERSYTYSILSGAPCRSRITRRPFGSVSRAGAATLNGPATSRLPARRRTMPRRQFARCTRPDSKT